ncbi:RNA polymerase sigma factor [Neolewinella persica]|uniref:RNA polymerase sigma factor n=1 Tax=Neolewinella persica TaxID=70998 RepID=UPI00146AFBCE|nr:RNA polymerase sigma factor [Neolewinella persica]
MQAHHEDAFRWASQCCRYNHHDAEEVLQMTYLKIAEGKARFNERSAFKTWLFAVIRYTALDYLKKRVRFAALDQLPVLAEEQDSGESTLDYRRLLARLPEQQQRVLLLTFYHDMSLSEVADVMELHIGTVRTHYSRGKDALRTLLKKESV